MEERLAISFSSKVTPVKPVNDEMTLCKCYIMYPGKNVNHTNITKEAVDDALPTLYNIPVVGHIYVDEENEECWMGGHDKEIVKGSDGKYRFKSLTVPYGVVPIQDGVHYEDVEETNGVIHTYQVADIILWTGRYPQLLDTSYSDEIYFNQSMEIKALDTTKESDGYTRVNKYKYSALCLLGKSDDPSKNVNPCFPQSRVEPYDFSETEKWDQLFEEFQEKLTSCYGLASTNEKGGKGAMNMEQILAILNEFGFEKIEDISFEITEEMTEDTLREMLSQAQSNPTEETPILENAEGNQDTQENDQGGEPAQEPVQEPAQEPGTDTAIEHSEGSDGVDNRYQIELTSEELRNALCGKLSAFRVWNEVLYKSYYLCDFDSEYVYVSYCIESDNQNESGYGRFAYVKTETDVSINEDSFEKVRLVWMTAEEAANADKQKAEYEALIKYRADKEEEEKRIAYTAVLEEFSDLSGIDEYKNVVGECMSFESVEALKEKLFAIRGKTGIFKKPGTQGRVPLDFQKDNQLTEEDEFMMRYLPGRSKK